MTDSVANAPTVSVIIAAYNRSYVLRHALKSVLAQDFTDFEILVIGDACTDDSQAVSASFGDARIAFFNLPINYGEQSGPNNVGIARARGRYIAFLSQDDFWLQDHLSVAVEWLEATSADMVHALTASISPGPAQDWRAGLDCMVTGEQFNPYFDYAPASTWLLRSSAIAKTGGFRPAHECLCDTSQDFLFRAWRAGITHELVPNLSVIVLASSVRPGSYVERTSPEHDTIAAEIEQHHDFRAKLLRRVVAPEQPTTAQRFRRFAERLLLTPFAKLGIAPRAIRYRLQGGYRRGAWIKHLHDIRGLRHHGASSDTLLGRLRVREMRKGPIYPLGTKIELGINHNIINILESGWGLPEGLATWTTAHTATLSFALDPNTPSEPLELIVEAQPFLHEHHPHQRVEFLKGTRALAHFKLSAKETITLLSVPIPAECRESDNYLCITISLPDAVSPLKLGISTDKRTLGLSVRSVLLKPATSL